MTRKASKRRAPRAWTRRLQTLYDRLNHTPKLSRSEKRRLTLEIAYLRAAIGSFGLLAPPMREASATPGWVTEAQRFRAWRDRRT